MVEDHEDSLEFLRTVLESVGHSCATARTSSEAIHRLDSARFDVVFLDMILPDSDGTCVARHIIEKKLKLPIVAVSAYLERWNDRDFNRLGIGRRVPKPYQVKKIMQILRELGT